MLTCEEVERDELVEHYVLGRLEKAQQEAFEDHYFSCSECLERLRIVEETRGELAAQAVVVRPYRWRRVAAGLAAAATLVLAVRVGQDIWNRRDVPPPSGPQGRDVSLSAPATPSVTAPLPSALGRIELPPYSPPRLRSTTTEAQRVFRDGMTSYTAGDCAAAIPTLRRALAIDESMTSARFYLAACELQSGRAQEASDHLQRVVAVGESPYFEDAHFFLAKAYIQLGNLAAARQQLARVVALRGDRLTEAQRLIDQLR